MLEKASVLERLTLYKNAHALRMGIEEIGLFGSYAKGMQTKQSDIDVYVRLSQANLFTLSRIRIDLEELFGKKVDIVQLREHMNNFLKRRIEADAVSA